MPDTNEGANIRTQPVPIPARPDLDRLPAVYRDDVERLYLYLSYLAARMSAPLSDPEWARISFSIDEWTADWARFHALLVQWEELLEQIDTERPEGPSPAQRIQEMYREIQAMRVFRFHGDPLNYLDRSPEKPRVSPLFDVFFYFLLTVVAFGLMLTPWFGVALIFVWVAGMSVRHALRRRRFLQEEPNHPTDQTHR